MIGNHILFIRNIWGHVLVCIAILWEKRCNALGNEESLVGFYQKIEGHALACMRQVRSSVAIFLRTKKCVGFYQKIEGHALPESCKKNLKRCWSVSEKRGN
ncbi:unnamed protein product [Albugo candida]|uniref:Secreted protein n=1 Tax=Albugo candida TaxID=65357 RepID=A0A024GDN5_9STRA|nr:unnamed protein product [Albugo candida]|eukprot:CCI44873.1 unnamed protein product [Albugo candida]